ncbi:MAG: putative toxin-antitoxin system toxin component, PIN family [Bryobacteraceae bacterium]
MIIRPRIVIDNNVLISRLLLPKSVPGTAVREAVDTGQLLVSSATLDELAAVLSRPKFDAYVSIGDRQEFIRCLGRIAEVIPIIYTVHACRDPKDNMFLEVAVNGNAQILITGDRDLLVLNPFHEIPIIAPAAYVEGYPQAKS